jgi:hypothetical protein
MTESDETTNDLGSLRRDLEERRLSDHAYAQRRAMLIMAAATFAFSWGGVRLSSIDALGLKITAWNERYLLAFSSAVLAYLIGNFATLVQPGLVAWRADFESFRRDSDRAIQEAAAAMREGFVNIQNSLAQTGVPDHTVATFTAIVSNFEFILDSKVPKYSTRYIELHRAKLRFEYLVPVGIALGVLYLVIPRILILA